ncbi:MAG TPA: hypothetical protein DCW90_14730 [Lachnospiraceae bacterium]|nr:hypothetical protein [Lachnospiraceae bacterium]
MAETKSTGRGRPKKVESQVDNTKAENEALKQELADLKAQMQLLMSTMSAPVAPTQKKEQRLIRIVNMCHGSVVLKGSTIWKIDGQFNYQDFLETEASIIVSNMPNMVRSGGIYIADEQFREEHNLTDVYRYLLSDEQMKNLLNSDPNYVIEAYKGTNDNQKQIIIDMICDKLDNGENVDGNVLITLSKLSGKDLLEYQNAEEE